MEAVTIDVTIRDKSGKGVARKLRAAGRFPAVLNRKGKSVALDIEKKPVLKVINSHKGEFVVFRLNVPSDPAAGERLAMIKEYQVHPVTGELVHMDLTEIKMDEKVITRVPVVIDGVSKGVKAGGTMEILNRKVKVECLPEHIVEAIHLDVTDVTAGKTVHASDLKLPEGLTLKTAPRTSLITVIMPKGVDEAEAAAKPAAKGKGKK
ncbi:MAG: 50S ribosomal protein L25 [Nitrospirae bacterium]|nr:50S ribosomal protein L25 [Nitrospirota bacterium]